MIFSAAAHVLLIVSLLAFSLYSCRTRRIPREITTFIDFQVMPPEDVSTPADVVKPAPVPPAPVPPAPPPAPSPDPAPKPKREIEISRKIVTRNPNPLQPPLTAQDILKNLKADNPPPRPVGARDDFTRYLAGIRMALHNAWHQPRDLAGAPVTEARIRVRRDGQVTQRTITKPSGDSAMDESVMAALESVARMSPLPAECGEHEDITIAFELTGP